MGILKLDIDCNTTDFLAECVGGKYGSQVASPSVQFALSLADSWVAAIRIYVIKIRICDSKGSPALDENCTAALRLCDLLRELRRHNGVLPTAGRTHNLINFLGTPCVRLIFVHR